jgi:UDP-N-acetylglucosamine--N-acetylmuramyl-(pentapeptide) pyrophosphoryl-undecaprenol N-acetylglucosamine transferase
MSAAEGGRPVLLAAGGTGGHLFPAQALAHALAKRGVPVELVTDERALRYGADFPARAIHTVASATPASASPVDRARAALILARGTLKSMVLMMRLRPRVIVGFGGYPMVPPIVAAARLRVPIVLHEQNAIMGRANRFLAKRANRIATGFPLVNAPPHVLAKASLTGNPVRPAVLAAAARPRRAPDDRLYLLVTGGSQGAKIFADVVPPAIASLAPEERARIVLSQQARDEDLARARATYDACGFAADLAPFFADLPDRIAAADLLIARAGASTVSEIAVVGRPAILVPYPHALDADQAANAAELAKTGAIEVVPQAQFTPDDLAARLRQALADPQGLTARAEAAKSAGILDAADRLADLVLGLAPGGRTA